MVLRIDALLARIEGQGGGLVQVRPASVEETLLLARSRRAVFPTQSGLGLWRTAPVDEK